MSETLGNQPRQSDATPPGPSAPPDRPTSPGPSTSSHPSTATSSTPSRSLTHQAEAADEPTTRVAPYALSGQAPGPRGAHDATASGTPGYGRTAPNREATVEETTRNRPTFEPSNATTSPLPPPFGYSYGEPTLSLGPTPTPRTKEHSLRKRGAAAIAAAVLAAGLVGGGAGAATTWYLTRGDRAQVSSSLDDTPPARSASRVPAGSVQDVANKVLPSVVSITIATPRGNGNGSGVILSSDGLILTNNHVVESAQRGAQLGVTFNDGTSAPARIVGLDPVTDLAVIRAEGVSGLKPAELGRSSELSVGQPVVAIGSPLGLSGTVTSGIVSALNRPVRTDDSPTDQYNTVIDAIQTDAAINPGNSGGALVDMSGQIVGINTAIATLGASMGGQSGSIGVGFAIPIDQARPIAKQLIETGRAEHAQLGVSVSQAVVGSGVTEGAQIQSLTPNGAAEKAGLQRGDVITKVDDRLVPDPDALIAAVRSHRPGDTVRLTYVRNGRTHTTTATLGSDGGQAPQGEEQQEEELPFPWSR